MILLLAACDIEPGHAPNKADASDPTLGLTGETIATSGCDDTAVSGNSTETEDCANAVDDDCDRFVDVGDPDCAVAGAVPLDILPRFYPETGDGPIGCNRDYAFYRGIVLPGPTDGTLTVAEATRGTIQWLDAGELLAGRNVSVAEASYSRFAGMVAASTLISLPDLDGDGSRDLLYASGNPELSGWLQYFGSVPADLDNAEALTEFETKGGGPIGPDATGDGNADAYYSGWTEGNFIGLNWFDLSRRGFQPEGEGFTKLNVTDFEMATDYGAGSVEVSGIDQDGDGIEELLIQVPGTNNRNRDWDYHGDLWVVASGFSTGAYADDVALFKLQTEDHEFTRAQNVGDLDGDGADDLLVLMDERFYVFYGPLSGARSVEEADLELPFSITEGTGGWHTLDFDGDGDLEFLFGTSADWQSPYLLYVFDDITAARSLDDADFTLEASDGGVMVNDVNGDGRWDIMVEQNILLGRPM